MRAREPVGRRGPAAAPHRAQPGTDAGTDAGTDGDEAPALTRCLLGASALSAARALQRGVPVHEGAQPRRHGAVLRGGKSTDQGDAQ